MAVRAKPPLAPTFLVLPCICREAGELLDIKGSMQQSLRPLGPQPPPAQSL